MESHRKTMNIRKAVIMGLTTLCLGTLANATDLSPTSEEDIYVPPRSYTYNYNELNNVETDIPTLTTELLGDKIDEETGTLRFSQTDVSIPGNFAIDVEITRTMSTPNNWYNASLEAGNWSLDIPHIRSNYVKSLDNTFSGATANTPIPAWARNQGCSATLNSNPNFHKAFEPKNGEPGTFQIKNYSLKANEYWHGDIISIPKVGESRLLQFGNSKKTRDNWKVDCVDHNGVDAFKVTLPNGTVYLFSELKEVISPKRIYMGLDPDFCHRIVCNFPPPPIESELGFNALDRDERTGMHNVRVFMQVTLITDRFGNTVEYDYDSDGNLDAIRASDGRFIDVTFEEGKLKSVTANNRTWTYDYYPTSSAVSYPRLESVTRPDNKQWEFSYKGKFWSNALIGEMMPIDPVNPTYCQALLGGEFIEITHPYGAVGTFSITERCIYQSEVPKIETFNVYGQGQPYQNYELPIASKQYALWKKELTLNSATEYVWEYDYGRVPGYYHGDDRTSSTTHRILKVDSGIDITFLDHAIDNLNSTAIINPDNEVELSFFDNRYGHSQGNKLYTAIYDSNNVLMSYTKYHYDSSDINYGVSNLWTASALTANIKSVPSEFAGQTSFDLAIASTKFQRKTQQSTFLKYGDIATEYREAFSNFNDYEQHQTIAQSGPSGHRTITLGFESDESAWILNQPTTVDVSVGTGADKRLSEKTYYPKTEENLAKRFNLKEEKWFGSTRKLFKSYHTVNGMKGRVNEVELYSDNTTKRNIVFNDYKRGKPQEIVVPNRYTSGTVSMTKEIDDNGWIESTTDFNGHSTHYRYNNMGHITSVTYPVDDIDWADLLFTYDYPATGGMVRTQSQCRLNLDGKTCIDPARYTETNTYDQLLRLVAVAKADSENTYYMNMSYDSNNHMVFESFPSLIPNETKGKRTEYDALERVKNIAVSGNGATQYTYLDNNQVTENNPRGYDTTTQYRAFGMVNFDYPELISSPENIDTAIEYDEFFNVTTIRQYDLEDSQTEYRYYDQHNNLCLVKRSDTGNMLYSYSLLGELKWQAQPEAVITGNECESTFLDKHKITYNYDNRGTIHQILYGDNTPTRTFEYDDNGNITSISSTQYNQSYNYNALNLLIDESLNVDGKQFDLIYGYDELGNVDSIKYPGDTPAVFFAPNGFGQPTQAIRQYDNLLPDVFVQGGVDKATYHENGMVHTFIYGNGVAHETTLNERLLPERISDTLEATSHVDLTYAYDNNFNITSVINPREAAVYSLTSLSYDGLDRLTSTVGGAGIGSSSISYDALGNIKTYVNDSAFKPHNLTYHYDSNYRLETVVNTNDSTDVIRDFSASNSYDVRGNVLKNGEREFKYNLANQMTVSGGSEFFYDGYDRRIKTVKDNNQVEYSMYSQSGKLLYRETSAGGINYIFLGDKLVAKEGTGVVKSNDGIMNYKPFGESIEEPKDDVGYTGHKFDKDLGLSYMQARYYDPVIGRFYSNDPVDSITHLSTPNHIYGFNRYAYANNNPYKFTDPTGMNSECWLCKTNYNMEALATKGAPTRQSVTGVMAEQVQGGRQAVSNRVNNAVNRGIDPTTVSGSTKDYVSTTGKELAKGISYVGMAVGTAGANALVTTAFAGITYSLDSSPENLISFVLGPLGKMVGFVDEGLNTGNTLRETVENVGTLMNGIQVMQDSGVADVINEEKQ